MTTIFSTQDFRKKPTCTLLLAVLALTSNAQSFDPSPFITGAKADINYLGGEYLNPVGTALGNGLNNSWYSTAQVHSLGGFHINIAPSVVFVPENAQTFKIENSKLQELELANPNDNIAPTAFGANEMGPLLRSKSAGNTQNFNTPSGVGFSYLPFANISLGVGIGLNTEVDLRFFPKSKITGMDDAKVGLFGIGIIHEVSRWFMDEDEPPFSLSAQIAYTSLSFNQPINSAQNNSDDQFLDMKSTGMTFRALLSKRLSILTLYGGLGYNTANTDVFLKGTYTYQPSPGAEASVTDPLSIVTSANGAIANLGLRFKILKAVTLFADYTFAEYSALSAGLGLDLNFD